MPIDAPALPLPRPRALLVTLVALLVLVSALLTAPAQASPTPEDEGAAPEGVVWSLTPTPERGQDRVSVRADLDPGASSEDAVVLTNAGAEPQTFELYASDGIVTEGGQFDIRTREVEATGSGTWITLEQERVELDAGESAEVPFSVQVPAEATPGDHPAGIVAVVAQEGADGRVQVENRVGVRLHLRVTGEVEPALAVSDVQTRYEGTLNPFAPGRVVMSYTVENVGNVRLGAATVVTGSGPFGLLAADSDVAPVREILPGQSMRLEDVEAAAWPLVRVGGEVSVTPVVVGEDPVVGDMGAVTDDAALWALPWTQLLVLLLLVGLLLLVRRRRRRARARRAEELERARAEGAREAQTARVG